MKLSTGQTIVIAGGVGLVGLYLLRKDPTRPFSLGDMFGTIMPNAPDQNQLANWFAANAGRQPSPAGTSGYGATSAVPALAGGIAQLGNAIANLFTRSAGPGNSQGPDQPRASASSGGGIAQPLPGISMPMFQGQLLLPNTDWSTDGDLSGLWNNINSGLYDAPGAWLENQNVSQSVSY